MCFLILAVESEFCIEEKYGIKLALVSIFLCDSFIKPQREAILFYKKKVVPFNFGFDLLENE